MDGPRSPDYSPSPETTTIEKINYNENFAMDINKRMRVPSQIMVGPSNDFIRDSSTGIMRDSSRDPTEWMHVPERICVTGNDRHIATREPPPEFKLEGTFLPVYDPSNATKQMISTPPRVLRIADISPAYDNEPEKRKSVPRPQSVRKLDQIISENETRSNDSLLMDNEDFDKEAILQKIRRRFILMDQRLDTLEIELARRNRRDMMLYSLGFIYILFRGITWFGNRSSF